MLYPLDHYRAEKYYSVNFFLLILFPFFMSALPGVFLMEQNDLNILSLSSISSVVHLCAFLGFALVCFRLLNTVPKKYKVVLVLHYGLTDWLDVAKEI